VGSRGAANPKAPIKLGTTRKPWPGLAVRQQRLLCHEVTCRPDPFHRDIHTFPLQPGFLLQRAA
jgi:hypothetical protein